MILHSYVFHCSNFGDCSGPVVEVLARFVSRKLGKFWLNNFLKTKKVETLRVPRKAERN